MPFIIDLVVHVFNLSLRSGYIPDSYKCAKVIPIFQSGSKSEFTNYRPISLLSSFSKLLEKIIAQQIFRYLNKFKLLHNRYSDIRTSLSYSTILRMDLDLGMIPNNQFYKFRPERTGFNMYAEFMRLQLTFLA